MGLQRANIKILNGPNFLVFKDIDVNSILFYLKFNVIKKCIFDLDARLTFSK